MIGERSTMSGAKVATAAALSPASTAARKRRLVSVGSTDREVTRYASAGV